MVDIFSKSKRSEIMRRIRGKHTNPELIVRRLAFSMGYRYRLHSKKLPGTPDLVFPKLRKVIFVHGCFWHGHQRCSRKRKPPKTNVLFWQNKIKKNKKRDNSNVKKLKELTWNPLIIWECETGDLEVLTRKIQIFLSGTT